MNASNQTEKFEHLVHQIDPQAKLIRHWPLTGGVSAQTTAIQIQYVNGQTQKMVVRQHGQADLRHNSNIAEDEYHLLRQLKEEGLAAPDAYYHDSAEAVFSDPCAVIEFIDGDTEFAPADLDDYLHQCATHLAKIHQIDAKKLDLSFLSTQSENQAKKVQAQPEKLDETINEGQVREVLNAAWPWPQVNETVLLHGDYWPGNLLWKDGQLVGVVDWEDAHLGDPLIDLAISRVEFALFMGVEAVEAFTHRYQSLMKLDMSNLMYWDLFAILRYPHKLSEWAEDELTEKKWCESLNIFIDKALKKLSI